MENISSIAAAAIASASAETTSTGDGSRRPSEQDKRVVNWLFDQLTGIFPAWRAAFDGDDGVRAAKRQWLTALVDAGITTRAPIEMGLRRAREHSSPFLPSTGEFIDWCRPKPEDHGLPTAADAWSQICREGGEYSHGVVLAVRRDPRVDAWSWRMLPIERGLRLFEPIYREYVQRALQGESFPLPTMVEDKRGRPVTRAEQREHARKYLAEAMAALR